MSSIAFCYTNKQLDFTLHFETGTLTTESRRLGRHWLVDLYQCSNLPVEGKLLKSILVTAAEKAGATIVECCFHQFSPHGLSGVVVIAESHLAAHTWPEHQALCIDIFSCSDKIEAQVAIEFIAEQVKAGKVNQRIMDRGCLLGAPS